MAARRMSARGLSMSRAAKKILKEKKRKKKLGIPEKEPPGSRRRFWIVVIAVLSLVGLLVASKLGVV